MYASSLKMFTNATFSLARSRLGVLSLIESEGGAKFSAHISSLVALI